ALDELDVRGVDLGKTLLGERRVLLVPFHCAEVLLEERRFEAPAVSRIHGIPQKAQVAPRQVVELLHGEEAVELARILEGRDVARRRGRLRRDPVAEPRVEKTELYIIRRGRRAGAEARQHVLAPLLQIGAGLILLRERDCPGIGAIDIVDLRIVVLGQWVIPGLRGEVLGEPFLDERVTRARVDRVAEERELAERAALEIGGRHGALIVEGPILRRRRSWDRRQEDEGQETAETIDHTASYLVP